MIFDKIDIKGFRGIRESHLSGLKQVNLFFGKNNCGKSSVLDALFLISGLSNPKLPFNINILRDYRNLRKQDVVLDFYNLDTNGSILISAQNGETRTLRIRLLKTSEVEVDLLSNGNNVSSSQTEDKYGLVLDYTIDEASYSSNITFTSNNGSLLKQEVHLDGRYEEGWLCKYLTPKYDFYASIVGLVDILKNKEEQILLDALRIIEPRVQDFVLSENDVLVDIGLAQRIPINMMGDGARKMFALLSAIYECAEGVVLIDEISNGFHHSVMKRMWGALISVAKKRNVQVFATTHDKDSIIGLRDAVVMGKSEDMVASFKLQKLSDDTLKAYSYSFEGLDYSLNQNIELR